MNPESGRASGVWLGTRVGRNVEGLSFLIWLAGDEMTGIGARKAGVKS